jgi:phage terminase large subunit
MTFTRSGRVVERIDTPLPSGAHDDRLFATALAHWASHPVEFVMQVLGAAPDPWQCDFLDAVMTEENVALRSCHGVGKTTALAWLILWFTMTRAFPKVPTTAPTFNKQVRDILWAEVHKWWRIAHETSPWLANEFELSATRLKHRQHGDEWFAVGIASSQPLNIEGYHSAHLLAVFDEAKAIPKLTWEAVHGMRTTQEAKLVCASTPGGPLGEFYKVFTQYRQTWKTLFVVHPAPLRPQLNRREAPPYSKGGTYYSERVRPEWITERAAEWGKDSPVYVARVVGDFPSVEGDVLIPYGWLAEAMDREEGVHGPRIVACDVARFGRDRTVVLAAHGGTLLHGETIARVPAESTAPEVETVGIGDNPKQPRYRAVDVTADVCSRVRLTYEADLIVIDETGIGGGVVDILRRRGEPVLGINFGAAPTDRPKDAEEAKSRQRRHLLDSKYANLKAQMGMTLRNGFEVGALGLANLTPEITDALVAQASMVRTEMDARGRIRIVDPDDEDELAAAAGSLEGRKSPDHFHALLLLWWAASGMAGVKPKAGAVSPATARIGERRGGVFVGGPGQRPMAAGGAASGQARSVQRWYR